MIGQAPAQLLYVKENVIAAIAIDGSTTIPLPITVTLGWAEAASVTMPVVPCGQNVNCGVFAPGLFTRQQLR